MLTSNEKNFSIFVYFFHSDIKMGQVFGTNSDDGMFLESLDGAQDALLSDLLEQPAQVCILRVLSYK